MYIKHSYKTIFIIFKISNFVKYYYIFLAPLFLQNFNKKCQSKCTTNAQKFLHFPSIQNIINYHLYIQKQMALKDDWRFPLIAIKDLTRWYPDSKKPLFKKLNFELFKWEFTVIIGKSGVWKSTIVKFLIWQLRPYTRTVYYRMDDMAHFSDADIQKYRQKIWIVFQDYKLIDALSVKENIIYPLKIQWDDDATIQEKYRIITSKLHIEDINKMDSKALSWWEKQKVAIARAMINNPEFIIADEPTWNLDWEYTQEIWDLLVEANKIWNTILLITHDVHLLNYIKSKTKVNVFQL